MPWIADVVDDKIQYALNMGNLRSLHIEDLDCNSFVANEFLHLLTSYEIAEQGLDKLILSSFYK